MRTKSNHIFGKCYCGINVDEKNAYRKFIQGVTIIYDNGIYLKKSLFQRHFIEELYGIISSENPLKIVKLKKCNKERNAEILIKRKQGLTLKEIGNIYGITQETIRLILKNQERIQKRIEQGNTIKEEIKTNQHLKENFENLPLDSTYPFLSVRAANCLKNSLGKVMFDNKTKEKYLLLKVKDLIRACEVSHSSLLQCKNFGKKSLNEVINFIENFTKQGVV